VFMWRTVADVGCQDEEGRAPVVCENTLQGLLDSNMSLGDDPQNVPELNPESAAMASVKAIRVFLRW